MNRQTKSLYKKKLSLKFHRGVDFMADAGSRQRGNHSEFSIVQFQSSKGGAVNSSFGASNNKHKSARGGGGRPTRTRKVVVKDDENEN